MNRATLFCMLLAALAGFWLEGPRAGAQNPNDAWRGSPADAAPTGPTLVPLGPPHNQPPLSQYPALQQRPAPPREPPVPFVLSPIEQNLLDQVLAGWEQRNKEVKTFDCSFVRWRYDPTFAKPGQQDQPISRDQGILKYAAPDKGLYRVDSDHPEQWLCDGRSIYEYKYKEKQVVEYPLPADRQGKAIADGPVPFVFGADTQKLKQRYFLRLTTPRNMKDEIWLLALPRYQADLANFQQVEILLKTDGMVPFAIQVYDPGGKSRTAYRFDDVVINSRWQILQGNVWHPSVPLGWKKHVDSSAQQASRSVTRN